MENSAYVPNHLPPPALVVFSQAGGLPEALRMQRPFNPQVPEAKDLHVPFGSATVAGFGLRHVDSYPGLPAHLLHHLQPQFVHPALDPRLPFGSAGAGAFRPLGRGHPGAGDMETGGLSAFAPPAPTLSSSGNRSEGLAGSVSPNSTPPLQPRVKEEGSDTPLSEDRDRDGTLTPGSLSEGNVADRLTPEEGRGYRRKKKLQAEASCCPVCGVTLRAGELEAHYAHELQRLYKLGGARARRPPPPPPPGPAAAAAAAAAASASADGTHEGRWETYQRIKANRQSRLRLKNRKRKADEATCPVCSERLSGSADELNAHVDACLRKHGDGDGDSDEPVDVEGGVFTEYEWAGQRRVRASALLVGGYAAAGLATAATTADDADHGDLVVDGDDSATLGPAQYSEADVLLPAAAARERRALRHALLSGDSSSPAAEATDIKEEPDGDGDADGEGEGDGDAEAEGEGEAAGAAAGAHPGDPAPDRDQLVEALKARIRQLEADASSADKFKCLICMERYKKPVISICCWHVHCEECWLRTLGAKKLCPQCNMITSPSDLRRIYM
ncbi:E3 ubiquitin-protein ligase Rnf220-like isoform X2 [Schistocerca gregaria]|uniref:E3 ubiquitin-protein ligase Rnf220-like isoform X2 n=1 Tax=Schistocerca gregaria TaxID=7010 RepID=UPI00211EA2A6|nr:E3 ubiquitin-protein ligase Rnf220-like isoform X2 [Schistocerca gregaria]